MVIFRARFAVVALGSDLDYRAVRGVLDGFFAFCPCGVLFRNAAEIFQTTVRAVFNVLRNFLRVCRFFVGLFDLCGGFRDVCRFFACGFELRGRSRIFRFSAESVLNFLQSFYCFVEFRLFAERFGKCIFENGELNFGFLKLLFVRFKLHFNAAVRNEMFNRPKRRLCGINAVIRQRDENASVQNFRNTAAIYQSVFGAHVYIKAADFADFFACAASETFNQVVKSFARFNSVGVFDFADFHLEGVALRGNFFGNVGLNIFNRLFGLRNSCRYFFLLKSFVAHTLSKKIFFVC